LATATAPSLSVSAGDSSLPSRYQRGAVLDLAEPGRRELAFLAGVAGLQQIGRPEEAAYVFGVVRGGHG
jgi:hypothetical protein